MNSSVFQLSSTCQQTTHLPITVTNFKHQIFCSIIFSNFPDYTLAENVFVFFCHMHVEDSRSWFCLTVSGSLQWLQIEMATYRHWSVSLCQDPDDVPHCRIMSPDKTEWRLISATLCGWKHCFVADQLCFMTRIREELFQCFGVVAKKSL